MNLLISLAKVGRCSCPFLFGVLRIDITNIRWAACEDLKSLCCFHFHVQPLAYGNQVRHSLACVPPRAVLKLWPRKSQTPTAYALSSFGGQPSSTRETQRNKGGREGEGGQRREKRDTDRVQAGSKRPSNARPNFTEIEPPGLSPKPAFALLLIVRLCVCNVEVSQLVHTAHPPAQMY